jgi:hypothetical protein
MRSSGKLAILSILALAFAAATASWWFRYTVTHRAAEFWGPQAAQLIRDAPYVKLYQVDPPVPFPQSSRDAAELIDQGAAHDASQARGLIHLRNALLQDRSYDWPPQPLDPNAQWQWALRFGSGPSSGSAILWFSPDWKYVAQSGRNEVLSCQPIAGGLNEFFGEVRSNAAESPR